MDFEFEEVLVGEKGFQQFYKEESIATEYKEKNDLETDIYRSRDNDRPNAADVIEETAPEKERVAFYQRVREDEYNKLRKAIEGERTMTMDLEREDDKVFQQNIKGYIRWIIDEACRDKDLEEIYGEKKSAKELQDPLNKDAALDNSAGTSETKEKDIDEETASEEERVSYFTQVRESEYSKLVEAMERERIRKEKRLAKKKQREELAKQIEYFFDVDDMNDNILQPKPKMEETSVNIEKTIFNKTPTTSDDAANCRFYSPMTFQSEDLQTFSPVTTVTVQQENYVTAFEQISFSDTYTRLPSKPAEDGMLSEKSTSQPLIQKKRSMGYLVKKLFLKKSKPKMKDDDNSIKLPFDLDDSESEQDTSHQENELSITPLTSDSEWYSTDLDDVEETPRPKLKPFFSKEDVLPYLQPMIPNSPIPIQHVVPQSAVSSQVTTESRKQDSRHLLRRLGRWIRKNVFCCFKRN